MIVRQVPYSSPNNPFLHSLLRTSQLFPVSFRFLPLVPVLAPRPYINDPRPRNPIPSVDTETQPLNPKR